MPSNFPAIRYCVLYVCVCVCVCAGVHTVHTYSILVLDPIPVYKLLINRDASIPCIHSIMHLLWHFELTDPLHLLLPCRHVYSGIYAPTTVRKARPLPAKWMALESLIDFVFTTQSDVWWAMMYVCTPVTMATNTCSILHQVSPLFKMTVGVLCRQKWQINNA